MGSEPSYEPTKTPFSAPTYVGGILPEAYHVLRANYHGYAEQFHRQQAEDFKQLSQLLSDQVSLPEQPPRSLLQSHPAVRASQTPIPTTKKRRDEMAAKRNQAVGFGQTRVSRSGSVQKLSTPSPMTVPAHISKALMVEPNLQRYSDSKQLPSRVRDRLSFRPNEVYAPLTNRPRPWGYYKHDGQDLVGRFEYTDCGELTPGATFTVEEIRYYLFQHPLHTKNGIYNPKESGLALRLQRNPADSKNRYGDTSSARCRFKDCIAQNRLIGQGQNRVAFDEISCQGGNHDPFIHVGYVHLYCLERYLPFPELCSKLKVMAENRELPNEPHGNNRMKFGSIQEFREAERFIHNCEKGQLSASYPRFQLLNASYIYEGSLNYKICRQKVKHEPYRVKKSGEARGGRLSTIDHHLGIRRKGPGAQGYSYRSDSDNDGKQAGPSYMSPRRTRSPSTDDVASRNALPWEGSASPVTITTTSPHDPRMLRGSRTQSMAQAYPQMMEGINTVTEFGAGQYAEGMDQSQTIAGSNKSQTAWAEPSFSPSLAQTTIVKG